MVLSATIAIFGSVAAIVSWLSPQTYEGVARVEIRPDPVIASATNASPPPSSQEAYQTQIEVIRSDRVLQIAAQKLGLASTEPIRDSLSPGIIKGTRIVEVRVYRPKPAEASLWANAVTDAYVQFRRITAIANGVSASDLLTRAIETANKQAEALDAQIAQNPANVADLRGQKDKLNRQVLALQTQSLAVSDSASLREGAATVLSSARTPTEPANPRPFRNMGIAALAGLVLGGPLSYLAYRSNRPQRLVKGWSGAGGDFDGGEDSSVLARVVGRVEEKLEGIEDRLAGFTSGEVIAAAEAFRPDPELAERIAGSVERRVASMVELASAYPQEGLGLSGGLLDQFASLAAGFEAMRAEFMEQAGSERAHGDQLAAGLAGLAADFHGMRSDLAAGLEERMTVQQEKVGSVLGQAKRTVEEVRLLRAEVTQESERRDTESQQRVGEISTQLSHQLGEVRDQFFHQLSAHQEKVGAMLESVGARLHEESERRDTQAQQQVGAVSSQLSHQLGEVRDQFFHQLSAHQEKVGAMLESVGARLHEESERRDTQAQQQVGAVSSQLSRQLGEVRDQFFHQLSAHQEKVGAMLESVGARLHEESERRDTQSQQKIGEISSQLSHQLGEVRDQFFLELSAQHEKVGAAFESMAAGSEEQSAGAARRLKGLMEQAAVHFKSEQEKFQAVFEQARGGILEEARADREEAARVLGRVTDEMLDRTKELAASLSDGLGDLKREMSDKMASNQEGTAAMLRSVESKLDGEFLQGMRSNRAEIAERLGNVDADVSHRLGAIGTRLTQALEGLRGELSDTVATRNRSVVAMIEAAEARRTGDGQNLGRSLNVLFEQVRAQIEAMETRFGASVAEIRTEVVEGTRSDKAEVSQRLAQVEREVAERVGRVSTQVTHGLKDLRDQLSRDLLAQQEGVATIIESVEARVDDQTSAAAELVVSRLKALEESVSDLAARTEPGDRRQPARRITGS